MWVPEFSSFRLAKFATPSAETPQCGRVSDCLYVGTSYLQEPVPELGDT